MSALIDVDAVGRWMDREGLPGGAIEGAELLAGGTQNILVRFYRGGRRYVLRRGPRHPRPKSNEVLRREMKVLAALAPTDVPHPRFIAGCTDETVLHGTVFYLMDFVEGFNPGQGLPALHAGDASLRRQMGFAAVDALARLGSVDPVALGLASLGHPEGFLERQVPRWRGELESYSRLQGYPGPQLPGIDAMADWLSRQRPRAFTPGILHGDYHFANLLFALDGPGVVAIVDWEMCTVGDPLLDLGWIIATRPADEADDPIRAITGDLGRLGGIPAPAELVARYRERSSRDLSSIAWYQVMAAFKLAIVLEGTWARALAGKAPMPVGEMLHAIALALLERAQRVIQTGEIA